jgi:hypothetical protein
MPPRTPAAVAEQNGSWDLGTAARAAATEADDEPFGFTYAGEHYEVPPQSQWPLKCVRLLAEGNLEEALPKVLGQDAYERLCEAGITFAELKVLFDKLGEVGGMDDLPNSGPPLRRGSTRT